VATTLVTFIYVHTGYYSQFLGTHVAVDRIAILIELAPLTAVPYPSTLTE
jgi:hypothetical protein